MMKARWWVLGALLAAAGSLAGWHAWAVNANPVPGSVWTWLGPTFGADWSQLPQLPTPMVYGCAGDGIADDTACLQAAINSVTATGSAGVLYFDGARKYRITAGLSSNKTIAFIGSNPSNSVYSTSCASGIIVNTNITALTLTAPSGTISGMCFQMATAAGTRTSGAAMKVGSIRAISTAAQGHVVIERNTVVYPYDGIAIGGDTDGINGPATQTNGNVVRDNVIISASHEAISHGRDSTGISTNGTFYSNNQIACFNAAATAVGYAFYDGDFWLDATGAGPYNCQIGTKVTPGVTTTGAGQGFNGSFITGVVGDTMGDVALLVDVLSATALGVNSLIVSNFWAATYTTTQAGGGAVRIQDTSGAGKVHSISLTGGLINICTQGGGAGHDITGIKILNDVFDVMIANNRIYPSCNLGSAAGTGISVNTPGVFGTSRISIVGNSWDTSNGQLAVGVAIAGATDTLLMSDNLIAAGAATPIIWSSNPNSRAVIKGNIGDLTGSTPAITAASAITAPFNEVFVINGTTAIQTMANMWSNRAATILPGSVFTIATTGTTGAGAGAGGKFCNGLTSTVGLPIVALWQIGNQCWHVK